MLIWSEIKQDQDLSAAQPNHIFRGVHDGTRQGYSNCKRLNQYKDKGYTLPLGLPAIPKRAKFFKSSHPIAPHPTCKKKTKSQTGNVS